MSDLDAALANIEAREAAHAAKRKRLKPPEPGDDPMFKAVNAAIAKAERVHRLATETVEIREYPCD